MLALVLIFSFSLVLAEDICIDNTAPTTPGTLRISDSPYDADGTVVLTWSASTDLPDDDECPGIVTYEVFMKAGETSDFLKVADVSTTRYERNGLRDGITYEFKVRAVDVVKPIAHRSSFSSVRSTTIGKGSSGGSGGGSSGGSGGGSSGGGSGGSSGGTSVSSGGTSATATVNVTNNETNETSNYVPADAKDGIVVKTTDNDGNNRAPVFKDILGVTVPGGNSDNEITGAVTGGGSFNWSWLIIIVVIIVGLLLLLFVLRKNK